MLKVINLIAVRLADSCHSVRLNSDESELAQTV